MSKDRLDRDTRVYSMRAAFTRRGELPWMRLEFGSDLVVERWRSHDFVYWSRLEKTRWSSPTAPATRAATSGSSGCGSATRSSVGLWQMVPSIRANLFVHPVRRSFASIRGSTCGSRPPPRGRVRCGRYVLDPDPSSVRPNNLVFDQSGAIGRGSPTSHSTCSPTSTPRSATARTSNGSARTYAIHASAGVELSLPWELDFRGTVFWREGLPVSFDRGEFQPELLRPPARYGLELLLRRSLANDVSTVGSATR